MKQNQIKINDSQVSISARKAPVFIRLILTLILSVLILIPIAVTFYYLVYQDGPHIGIAMSFILCWGVGFYLLRITLWNWAGQEILTLNQENISYNADYRFFKDGRKEIVLKDLETEIIYEDESNKQLGRLRLKNKSTSIESVLQVRISELKVLKNKIKTHYNKV